MMPYDALWCYSIVPYEQGKVCLGSAREILKTHHLDGGRRVCMRAVSLQTRVCSVSGDLDGQVDRQERLETKDGKQVNAPLNPFPLL